MQLWHVYETLLVPSNRSNQLDSLMPHAPSRWCLVVNCLLSKSYLQNKNKTLFRLSFRLKSNLLPSVKSLTTTRAFIHLPPLFRWSSVDTISNRYPWIAITSPLAGFCAPTSKSNVFELTPRKVICGGADGFVPSINVIVRFNVPKLFVASQTYSPNRFVLFKYS